MSKKFRILATSDVHGYILPINDNDKTEGDFGLAKIKTIFDQYRDANTIFIDNGDLIQGSPLTYYFNTYHPLEISPITNIVKELKYDYFNLGNHDFNFGITKLNNHLNNCGGKIITNNIKIDDQKLSELYHTHLFANGVKIAIFGIVTHFIDKWESKETLKHLSIEDSFKQAKSAVEAIKKYEKVDAIVGVYHGGFEKDLITGQPTERQSGENIAYKICNELELDILITGHQHRSLKGECCGVVISQTAHKAQEVAKIEFDVIKKVGEVELIKPTLEANADIVKQIQNLNKEYQSWLDKPLGHSELSLKVTDRFQARLHKHPVISFINQVQLAKTQADFSSAALFNDAIGFNCDITIRDIVATYVYTNTLCVLRLTGHVLKEYLEKCAEYFSLEQDEIVVNNRFIYPKPQHYNYDMLDGLEYIIDVSKPLGDRIVSMTKDDKPLDLDKYYTIAVSNYRAGGSGGFEMLDRAELVLDIQEEMVEILIDYIIKNPELKVKHRENIKIIK
ncbi:MAG: bifunctional metallophosphatase/5'-nucleotidase [Erysipelotrichaceae bacterium]